MRAREDVLHGQTPAHIVHKGDDNGEEEPEGTKAIKNLRAKYST